MTSEIHNPEVKEYKHLLHKLTYAVNRDIARSWESSIPDPDDLASYNRVHISKKLAWDMSRVQHEISHERSEQMVAYARHDFTAFIREILNIGYVLGHLTVIREATAIIDEYWTPPEEGGCPFPLTQKEFNKLYDEETLKEQEENG